MESPPIAPVASMVSIPFLSCCYLTMMSEPSSVPAVRRKPTVRSLSSSLSTASVTSSSSSADAAPPAAGLLAARAAAMGERARQREPLTPTELDAVRHSLDNLAPRECAVDGAALARLLREEAHRPHTDWARTERNAAVLGALLTRRVDRDSGDSDGRLHGDAALRQVLERILRDGNWDGAVRHAAPDGTPASAPAWAVLVTGVNGIRKTTSLYMPWFAALLREALVPPEEGAAEEAAAVDGEALARLPTGGNSFFRQLDHMIATLCNEEFAELYRLTAQLMDQGAEVRGGAPSPLAVAAYSTLKAAIFARYRTLSEWLGAWLLQEAQQLGLNCLLETSGRDVAMFHYVDHFFPATPGRGRAYRKLALHFQINSLDLAKRSVDERMSHEILVGRQAVASNDVWRVIDANAGGPYGSDVLEGVQRDSDRVWREQILSSQVGRDWYKATIQINAHADEPWTAQAVGPDGTLGTVYRFDSQLL